MSFSNFNDYMSRSVGWFPTKTRRWQLSLLHFHDDHTFFVDFGCWPLLDVRLGYKGKVTREREVRLLGRDWSGWSLGPIVLDVRRWR